MDFRPPPGSSRFPSSQSGGAFRRLLTLSARPTDAPDIYAQALAGLQREAVTARSDSARVAAHKALFDRFDASSEGAKLVAVGSSLKIELLKRLDALLPTRALGAADKKEE